MEALGAVLVGLVMLAGLAGTIVPVFPGLLVMWLAGVVHAGATGMDGPSWAVVVVLTVLASVGSAASLVLPTRGAAAGGRAALAGGVVGALVGAVVLPVLGLPIGGLTGILLTERVRTGDMATAWKVTKGVLRGVGIGAIVELSAGTLMLSSWLAWVVLG
jgi:uncharacterized protein